MVGFADLVDSRLAQAPESWRQGRAMFGGVVAAAALARAREHADGRIPVTMQLVYSGPVTGPSTVTVTPLSSGRSYTSVRSSIHEGDKLRCSADVCFGVPRPDTVRMQPPLKADLPDRDSLMEAPFLKGMMPDFLQHFAIRYSGGGLPFTGSNSSWLAGWCRHRTPAGSAHEALIGLMDAWPTPALSIMTAPHAASTVSWSLSFVDVPDTVTTDDWFFFDYRCTSAANGHTHNRGRMWDASGKLVAEGRQLIAVYG